MYTSYLNPESAHNPVYNSGIGPVIISYSVKDPKTVTFIALGIVAALGGIFLLLAAFNVLPHGINAISQLGLGGKVLGGVVIGLGLFSIGYGLFLWDRSNQRSFISTHEENYESHHKQVRNHEAQKDLSTAIPATNEVKSLNIDETDNQREKSSIKAGGSSIVVNSTNKETGQALVRSGAPITENHIESFLQYRDLENKKYSHATAVTFFYYNCDGFNDYGWGCAWRCIQTCASSLNLFPTFSELYQTYRIDEHSTNEWAEPGYGMRYFDNVGAPSSQLVLYKRDKGTNKTPTKYCDKDKVSNFSDLRDMMLQHFETHGTPIMADDETYTFTIIGIRVTSANETILFIADPHKLSALSGLYYVALKSNGRQLATTGIDNGKNGLNSVGRLHFNKGWMFLFPKKNISQINGSLIERDKGGPSLFTMLPTEVMINIFQYLQPQKLCIVSTVCKQWNNLSGQNIIWKEHFLINFDSVTTGDQSATIDYKSECKKQKLSVSFDGLIRNYHATIRSTAGCGSRGQRYIDTAWNKIDAFARSHPEFRARVPKKTIQYDDGYGGFASGFSNYSR